MYVKMLLRKALTHSGQVHILVYGRGLQYMYSM